jgi:hypothetical protein
MNSKFSLSETISLLPNNQIKQDYLNILISRYLEELDISHEEYSKVKNEVESEVDENNKIYGKYPLFEILYLLSTPIIKYNYLHEFISKHAKTLNITPSQCCIASSEIEKELNESESENENEWE